MAASVAAFSGTPGVETPPGAFRRAFFTVTFDASYPTGGYAVSAAQFGLSQLVAVLPEASSAGRAVWFDSANVKLKCFASAGTEVTNATDLHTETVVVEAIGY